MCKRNSSGSPLLIASGRLLPQTKWLPDKSSVLNAIIRPITMQRESSYSLLTPSDRRLDGSIRRPFFFLRQVNLPPGRSKCPMTPLFSKLCLFLEFPVSVLHELFFLFSPLSFPPLSPSAESFLLECVLSSSSAFF